MSGAISPLPQYAFVVWCSFKAQGQLYLLPYIPKGRQVLQLAINMKRQ